MWRARVRNWLLALRKRLRTTPSLASGAAQIPPPLPPLFSSLPWLPFLDPNTSKSHLLSLLLLRFCFFAFFHTCTWFCLPYFSLKEESGKCALRNQAKAAAFLLHLPPLSPGFSDSRSLLAPASTRTMGDHLALRVDHLLTESTLEAAIGNKQEQQGSNSALMGELGGNLNLLTTVEKRTSSGKLVECRICQEEDQDANMEIPCSCCGSLKYAHRVCIQRWCNEKGDTICEICLQQYKPGYTTPKIHYGDNLMNFRGNWEISGQDLDDAQIITMVPPGFIRTDYYDYSAPRTRGTFCCRSVTAIFMVLLFLRHTLPLLIDGADQYSFTLFSLLVLKTAAMIVPFLVMVGTFTTYHRFRRQRAVREVAGSSSELENL